MSAKIIPPEPNDYAWIRARAARLQETHPGMSSEAALMQACEERAEHKEREARRTRSSSSKPLSVSLGDIIKARKGQ